jgi:hypothetical protein
MVGWVRRRLAGWASWYRWTTLAMLACAFLTITAAAEHTRGPAPRDLVPLTRNEISRLFATLIIYPARDAWHRLRWVRLAPAPPAPSPGMPLPPASQEPMTVTINSWVTWRPGGQRRPVYGPGEKPAASFP